MKPITIIFAVMLMASFAFAQEKFVIEDESAFKVLNEITTGYTEGENSLVTTYIILENQSELNELQSKEQELNFSIMTAQFEGQRLESDNKKSEESIVKSSAILSQAETERNQTRSILAAIDSRKSQLEKTINSSVLMPPGSYNIGAALFLIIVILTITMKSRGIFLKSQLDMKRKGIEKERMKE